MSIETRITKLEALSVKKKDNTVEIYIPGENEVLIFDEPSKVIPIEEYTRIKSSWTNEDIVINVTPKDYDDY